MAMMKKNVNNDSNNTQKNDTNHTTTPTPTAAGTAAAVAAGGTCNAIPPNTSSSSLSLPVSIASSSNSSNNNKAQNNNNVIESSSPSSIPQQQQQQSQLQSQRPQDDPRQRITPTTQSPTTATAAAATGTGREGMIISPSKSTKTALTTTTTPQDQSASISIKANDKNNDNDNTTKNNDNSDPAAADPAPVPAEIVKLYKSTRFKGYLTIALASIINQNAAALSSDPAYVNAVSASPSQKRYAQAVSIGSFVITGIVVLLHLDRYSPLQSFWVKAFAPQSKIELAIIAFLLVWWSVATVIQTGVRGIAGDGKEQYNLYCSTWLCCYTTFWMMERKLLEFGYPTMRGFITSWPYRAPGWIAIFISCFFTVFWYVDLFINTSKNPDRVAESLKPFYSNVAQSQYQWLLFVSSITMLPSAVFIFAELVREGETTTTTTTTTGGTNNNNNNSINNNKKTTKVIVKKKGNLETILEGFCLFLLAAGWIPSVIVATTPGGFASLIGNAYFFTWGTTIFVVETFLWFIHDFRGNVHKALQEKEAEYKRHQQDVLRKSRQYMGMGYESNNDIDVDVADWDYIQQQVQQEDEMDNNNNNNDTNNNNNNDQGGGKDDDDEKKRVMFANPNNININDNNDDEEDPVQIYLSPTSQMNSPQRFPQNKDNNDDNDNDEDSVKREQRFKETNSDDYYDMLYDILEL